MLHLPGWLESPEVTLFSGTIQLWHINNLYNMQAADNNGVAILISMTNMDYHLDWYPREHIGQLLPQDLFQLYHEASVQDHILWRFCWSFLKLEAQVGQWGPLFQYHYRHCAHVWEPFDHPCPLLPTIQQSYHIWFIRCKETEPYSIKWLQKRIHLLVPVW